MEKHNGYTNYPTWIVASTIDNVLSLHNMFYGKIIAMKREKVSRENARTILVNLLRDRVKAMMPGENLIWSPIINDIAANYINYIEIAEMIMEPYYED